MDWTSDWSARAACRGTDPDTLFVQGAAQNRAKAVCMGCPVRTECLADALDNRVEFGVWGGMTERERRALLRRRPNVTLLARLLRPPAASTRPRAPPPPGRSRGRRAALRTWSSVARTSAEPRPARFTGDGERCADEPQPVEVVHVVGQGRHLGHRAPCG